jgi:transposase InsO family protein
MGRAFVDTRRALREAKKLKLTEFDKRFTLKTDASRTGLGAVLLQENKEGSWVPVQWASRKPSEAEIRYGITEKEVLAVIWGIKKFDYELRGRRFHPITDHKVLEGIRTKERFGNDRVCKWIEKIQEYGFSVKYGKGEELVAADALSRLYEEDGNKRGEERKAKNAQGEETKKKNWDKHVIEISGQKCWRFDSGKVRKIPEPSERRKLALEMHKELVHGGTGAVYYKSQAKWHWPGMKEMIDQVIKKCEVCNINDRKKLGGGEFVTTTRKLEKVGDDLAEIGEEGKCILVVIDHFTRILKVEVLRRKNTVVVTEAIDEAWGEDTTPEEVITDNEKELCSETFEEMCRKRGIKHRRTGVESHKSNGRVERAIIRTLREGLAKDKSGTLEERVGRIEKRCNNTYHTAIKCTPSEAWNDNCETVSKENGPEGSYKN